MSHISLAFQLLTIRHVAGKKDPTKNYTILGGVVSLPDGQQAYAEMFADGKLTGKPGNYTIDLDISANQERRLELRFKGIRASA